MHYFKFPLSSSSTYNIATNGLITCLDPRCRHMSTMTKGYIRSVKGHLTQRLPADSYLQTAKTAFHLEIPDILPYTLQYNLVWKYN